MKSGINEIYAKRITELDQRIQQPCRALLQRGYDAGLDARVISGLRNPAEQTKLWNQGRSTPGRIVTYARAGYSWHNFGLSFDLGIFTPDGAYIDSNDTALQWLGPIGERLGLAWAGRWKSPDFPHFQLASLPVTPTAEDRRRIGL
jgi:peptidoglycan LD-endopeptidase CwlK